MIHDINNRVIPDFEEDGDAYYMTTHFSPVWLALIFLILHLIAYGFAVRADYRDHKTIDQERNCMGYILHNHLFLSPFFTMSVDKTRVAKVTIIFA